MLSPLNSAKGVISNNISKVILLSRFDMKNALALRCKCAAAICINGKVS